MNASVIVPWRGGDPARERLWAWNKARWLSYDYEVIECDSGIEPFTRGSSINEGVERATHDRLILADADTAISGLPQLGAVPLPVGMWWVLYDAGLYCALTEATTDELLRAPPAAPIPVPRAEQCRDRITSHSGLLMVRRDDFDKIGGYDSGFCGWGYEDDAFWHALVTLVGMERRLERRAAVHLYHPHIEAERFEQPYIEWNRAISDTYAERTGDVEAMSDWVVTRRHYPESLVRRG